MPKKVDEKVEISKEGDLYVVDERYVNSYTKDEIKLAYQNFLAKKQNLVQQTTEGVAGVKKEMTQLKLMIDSLSSVKDKLEGTNMQQLQQMIQQYNNYEKMMNPEVLAKQQEDIKNIDNRLAEIRGVAQDILVEEKKEERKNPQQAKAIKQGKPKPVEAVKEEIKDDDEAVEVEVEEKEEVKEDGK